MTAVELAESIVRFIAKNAERESRFLTPYPAWEIDAHSVLDHIAEVTGLSEEQINAWCIEAKP